MTDRTLPNLLPTTDAALFERTLAQAVAVDEPPPSEPYRGRGTSLAALPPIDTNNFYSAGVRHRLLVVFTDGETLRLPLALELTLQPGRETPPVFVHVWSGFDRIRGPGGRVDAAYRPDPASTLDLARYAALTGGRVFGERSLSAVAATARREAGRGTRRSLVSGYARIALAPWFVLAAVA